MIICEKVEDLKGVWSNDFKVTTKCFVAENKTFYTLLKGNDKNYFWSSKNGEKSIDKTTKNAWKWISGANSPNKQGESLAVNSKDDLENLNVRIGTICFVASEEINYIKNFNDEEETSWVKFPALSDGFTDQGSGGGGGGGNDYEYVDITESEMDEWFDNP